MDPDLFITVAFSSFVFLVGITGVVAITVAVLRSNRDASLDLPADAPELRSRLQMRAPSRQSTEPEPSPPQSVPSQ
jgi:hypothetical protein